MLAQSAFAGFIGSYDPGQFTLTNSNANGTANFNGSASLTFTGGNNGSGLPGSTDLTVVAPAPGLVAFDLLFASPDDPGWDVPGYLLDNSFTPFILNGNGSGSVSFPVAAGQRFGFRIDTLDNGGEAGVLTVSNFQAPDVAGAEVPEPGFFGPLLLLALAFVLRRILPWSPSSARRIMWLGSAVLTCLCIPEQIFAQSTTTYSGNDVTGQLILTRIVNATQLASAQPIKLSVPRMMQDDLPEWAPAQHSGRLRPAFDPIREWDSVLPQWLDLDFVSPKRALLKDRRALPLPPAMLQLTPTTQTTGFLGLTHGQQRSANNGNQFSVEPPNPSVAVGKGFLLQGVNNAIQIFSLKGEPQLAKVLSSNELFGVSPAINRVNGVNGVYPTDMRVFYDHGIERWFVLQRSQENDGRGDPLLRSRFYMAVSRTDDPRGDYYIYEIDTTNPANPNCPCVADYPQIGADEFGFYISSNEYHAATLQFSNAQIHAISKSSLAQGSPLPTTFRIALPFTTGYEFALEPSRTPPGASYYLGSGGLEWFVSSQSRSAIDSRLAVWALYNTSSLQTSAPALVLSRILIQTFDYSFPQVARQKPGPAPYGSSLTPPQPLAFIDGGDNRVQSVAWAAGRLYVTQATTVVDPNNNILTGTAFWVLSPTFRAGVLNAPILQQGTLAVANNHLLRPSLMVNALARGAIAATLAGPDFYPSAVVIPFTTLGVPGTLEIAGAGVLPQDGFTGYNGGGLARWGDYSTAVLDADGSVWMTAQFIPNAPITGSANWGTYIYRYLP